MFDKWAYYGTFKRGIWVPTVVLDQNISVLTLAIDLEAAGYNVARALNTGNIPDQEIREEAEKYDALLVTRDTDFSHDTRALVIRNKRFSSGKFSLVRDSVDYIYGVSTGYPEGYFDENHKNGKPKNRTNFGHKLDDLREYFRRNHRNGYTPPIPVRF